MELLLFGKRILILIPHPDDEVVGCCAAVGRAHDQGAQLFGAYLTTGVPARELLWKRQQTKYEEKLRRRKDEALSAARLLDIEPAFFQDIPTRMLKTHLKATREALIRAIQDLEIERLWTPAYEGGHQDHDTANFLASTLLGFAEVWEFSEYHFFNGKVTSQEFLSPNGTEEVIVLEDAERTRKQEALDLYRSERGNLRHIRTLQEAFRPLARYDYTAPPHRGKLFYQRFQWVPRHPRIDYCRPEEVCRAFSDFLTGQK